jgi:hypothetical protein
MARRSCCYRHPIAAITFVGLASVAKHHCRTKTISFVEYQSSHDLRVTLPCQFDSPAETDTPESTDMTPSARSCPKYNPLDLPSVLLLCEQGLIQQIIYDCKINSFLRLLIGNPSGLEARSSRIARNRRFWHFFLSSP